MARLELRLFGGLEATLDGVTVTAFESVKVRALLAYLAAEADRPQSREALAGLLWPDWPQQSAIRNLRNTLVHLRQNIGERDAQPPFLLVTRESIQLNREADAWVDVIEFENATRNLPFAISLYRGPFLDGFPSTDSPPFEEWVLAKREYFSQQVLKALGQLAEGSLEQGECEQAEVYARRQIELEPWREQAYQQLMTALSLKGERVQALAQFESLREALQRELRVEPSEETKSLYEAIRDGNLERIKDLKLGPRKIQRGAAQNLRSYLLREQLGKGGFGIVYRAEQPSVGREVAIKVILPEYANQPDFIRRFEVEAQLVAHLEHPYIVPLYDYWREPDGAYLVMRYMHGGNLRHSLERGAWEVEKAARLLDQIASALAVAHRQGVIHRDVKPENILLDEEGNAYLSDFGIAKQIIATGSGLMQPTTRESLTGAILGSPDYISPEQVQSKPVVAASDLYSLGVVTYEILTGSHPFPGLTPTEQLFKHLTDPLPHLSILRPDLPEALDEVIQRATAIDPALRYSDALSFAADFRAALGDRSRMAAAPLILIPPEQMRLEAPNPYKGLRAFQEADAAEFYGREALIEQLLRRLSPVSEPAAHPGEKTPDLGTRFLAVVGPSGSGKSSVVKAGLIPALRRGALPGSDRWFILEMTPGAHPFDELEVGLLRIASSSLSGLMEQLRRDERGLLRCARLVLPGDDSQLLLVIDQFEELFTLTEDKAEARHFLRSLLAAVTDPHSVVRVVVTLRADFYDRPLMYPDFSTLVQQRTEVVVPLTADELARAIQKPAEGAGAAFEEGLTATIVADVRDQISILPLLQYTLTELFERRLGRLLTLEAYQMLGGVLGVLGRRAEEIYASLDATGQSAARQLFLRLVALGEGTEDTRRRVLRTELESMGAAQNWLDIERVLEAYGQARLLSFDRDPATRTPTVELAHEALLREWGRLRAWLDESRADIRLQRLLAAAAAEWIQAGRDSSFLLSGARLSQFEGWAGATRLALTQEERSFLEASLEERRVLRETETRRQQQELETAKRMAESAQKLAETETVRAEEQARATRRLRQRALYLAGALLVALLMVGAAVYFGWRANRQATINFARELGEASLNNLNVDPERSILLSLQSAATWSSVGQELPPEQQEILHQAVRASRVRLVWSAHGETVGYVGFNPADGQPWAVTGTSQGGKATIWNVQTSKALAEIPGRLDYLTRVAFSPDMQRVALPGEANEVNIWEISTGQVWRKLTGHTDPVVGAAYSPDGRLLISFSGKEYILWELETGKKLWETPAPSMFGRAIFSPDSKSVVMNIKSEDNIVQLADALSGRVVFSTTFGTQRDAFSFAFSPDGTRLAMAGRTNEIQVWDTRTGQLVLNISTNFMSTAQILDITFSPDGKQLAFDRYILDATTGQEQFQLLGLSGEVSSLTYNADGTRLITVSLDGTIKIWDLTALHEVFSYQFSTEYTIIYGVAFSPDGKLMAVPSGERKVYLWDTTSWQAVHILTTDHTDFVTTVAFSPDGKFLATASADRTVKVWDTSTWQLLRTLTGHTEDLGFAVPSVRGVVGVAFSPQCKDTVTATCPLASIGFDGKLVVWDARNGQTLLSYQDPQSALRSMAYSPDGKWIALGTTGVLSKNQGDVKVLEAASGKVLQTFTGYAGYVWGVDFSPDGKRLATVSWNGPGKIWDLASGKSLVELKDFGGGFTVLYSPDGRRLVTGSNVKLGVDIWDASSGLPLFKLSRQENTSLIWGLAFSPGGKFLATGGVDGILRVYVLDPQDLLALARSRLTRGWQLDECQKYLHRKTCP